MPLSYCAKLRAPTNTIAESGNRLFRHLTFHHQTFYHLTFHHLSIHHLDFSSPRHFITWTTYHLENSSPDNSSPITFQHQRHFITYGLFITFEKLSPVSFVTHGSSSPWLFNTNSHDYSWLGKVVHHLCQYIIYCLTIWH